MANKSFLKISGRFAVLPLCLCLTAASVHAQLADQDLKSGISALADARYNEAERCFIRYLASNQQMPSFCTEAMNYLCMAVFKQKKYSDVIRLLDENADITSLDKAGVFEYWRARSALELGKTDEAISIVDNAIQGVKGDGIDSLRLYRLKGIALSRSTTPGAVEAARAAFSNANARASLNTGREFSAFRLDNYLDWAEAEQKSGNKNEAEKILSEQYSIFHSVSNSVSAQKGAVQYSKLLIGSGREREAGAILTSIAENAGANPANRAEAIVTIPRIISDTNKLESLYSVLTGLELPPEFFAECEMRFGKELATKDDKALQTRGVSILSAAVKRNTTSQFAPECQLVLANTWLILGSNSMASAEFKNYTEAFSGDKTRDYLAKKGRATALFSMKNYDEAALFFTEAAGIAGSGLDSAKCLAQAADAYYNSAKFSRSAELYKQAAATALASGDTALSLQCRFKSADSAEQTGDLATALAEFNDIASDPGAESASREASLRKALIYEQQGNNEDAEISYSSVLNTETNDVTSATARLGRGRTRYRRFKFKSALADLETGKIPAAYTNLTDEAKYIVILAKYGIGKDEEAFNTAIQFMTERKDAKNLPDVILWAAQYEFNRKNYAAAEKHFLGFASEFPDNQVTQYALLWAADAAFRQSEFVRANETLAKISKINSDQEVIPEARLLQARSLRELTRYEDALSVLDEIITDFPADDLVVKALILKGETLFVIAGKEPEGKGYLKAEQAFASALLRSDITPDQIIECSYNTARCFEKAGDYRKAIETYCVKVINRYADYSSSHIHLSSRSADFFAKATLNAALLLENNGDIEGAVQTLHHLATTSLPESEKASLEIRRLRTK